MARDRPLLARPTDRVTVVSLPSPTLPSSPVPISLLQAHKKRAAHRVAAADLIFNRSKCFVYIFYSVADNVPAVMLVYSVRSRLYAPIELEMKICQSYPLPVPRHVTTKKQALSFKNIYGQLLCDPVSSMGRGTR